MKYRAEYSPEKFRNFNFDAQLKAMAKLLRELELKLSYPEIRIGICKHIEELKPLFRQSLPPKLDDLLAKLPNDPHRLLRALAIYHDDALLKDDQISIRVGDGSVMGDPLGKLKAAQICVVADNLRSVFNVGSLFRVCECLAIGELQLCGISPTPKHPHMEKTALGTCERVSWKHSERSIDALNDLKVRGYRIYALETAEPSASVFEASFAFPMALVVGNEALGIAPELLQLCDEIVHLPVLGWKNSLNVSVATTVALYQILYGVRNGK